MCVPAPMFAVIRILFLDDTDESFLNLDHTAASTKVCQIIIAYSFSNAVRRKPRRFERHAKDAVQLVTASALLSGAQLKDNLQPDIHLNEAAFKYRSSLYRKRRAALVTLVPTDTGRLPAHLANPVYTATMGVCRTMRPDASLSVIVGGLFVMELWTGQYRHNLFSFQLFLGFRQGQA